jgi:vancomycin resistance protein YoaR
MAWILALFLALSLVGCANETIEGIAGTEIVQAEEASEAKPKESWTLIDGGSFSTEYDKKFKNRSLNLGIAAKTLNNAEVAAGETFSFNEVVGVATWAKGYRPAQIFVKGREEKGIGGGVCQLSSTLYNAALNAGLEITERHPHSKRVFYVEEGRDAAVYFDRIDLKFKNTLERPIKIEAKAENGTCTVEIKQKA